MPQTHQQSTTWLGAGIGYRACYRTQLLDNAEAISELPVLEVIPQHFFARPADIDALAERFHLVFHDTDLPLATMGTTSEFFGHRLKRIKELAERAKPACITSHLAMTSSPRGVDIGHLAPLWYTEELLALLVERIQRVQDQLQLPLALENLAGFAIPGSISQAEFFTRLVESTDCGILLDLSNLLVDARNRGVDPAALMGDYPLGATMQVHLSGGKHRKGMWIDSHSTAVEDESFALLKALRRRASPLTIIVERDQNFPDLSELVTESARAARLWEEGL